jgi:alkanesulfonate monooxygenase SsuD/methylene tetrahydromethanopterin reductase-like flavin-dependent oxidoreductase (luciferase family)
LYPNRWTLSTSLTVVLGFAVPQFGESGHLNVGELARFASTAEQLGADSLWVGDRLLAAVNPTVGYVGTDTIPEQFRTILDPFIALTVAATATTAARLGSSLFVAPWHPPVQLARQLTSIDVISGGRLLPEFGIGWMAGVRVPGGVSLDMLNWQRQTIDDAARAAGRDPSAIHAYVRVNVAEGTPVDKVADAVQVLADNGYPDAFVDLMYVAAGTDAHLEWVERLLAR